MDAGSSKASSVLAQVTVSITFVSCWWFCERLVIAHLDSLEQLAVISPALFQILRIGIAIFPAGADTDTVEAFLRLRFGQNFFGGLGQLVHDIVRCACRYRQSPEPLKRQGQIKARFLRSGHVRQFW